MLLTRLKKLQPSTKLAKHRLENPPFEDVLCVGIPVDFPAPQNPQPFRFFGTIVKICKNLAEHN